VLVGLQARAPQLRGYCGFLLLALSRVCLTCLYGCGQAAGEAAGDAKKKTVAILTGAVAMVLSLAYLAGTSWFRLGRAEVESFPSLKLPTTSVPLHS
jgi:hypothetical protein